MKKFKGTLDLTYKDIDNNKSILNKIKEEINTISNRQVSKFIAINKKI